MFSFLKNHWSWTLLFVRIVLGVTFILHGYQKWTLLETSVLELLQLPHSGTIPEGMPMYLVVIFNILAVVEPLAGIAFIIGIFTSWAALATAIIMVGAIVFKIQMLQIPFAAGNTTGWEFDLALLALSLSVLTSGGGPLSLDAKMMSGKKKK